MKLVVVGLGSMGKRRLRLLLKNYPDLFLCGVDPTAERRSKAKELFGISTYEDLETAVNTENPEAALICSPPETHSLLILACLQAGMHVFSEINLRKDRYGDIAAQAELRDVKLFLSSTLLYRGEIEFIRECVRQHQTKVNYRYHVGQYLPDWHPWDGRDFFVWNKSTNGCREIFAIDLPWIVKTFGKVKAMTVLKDKLSCMDIDYPDNYIVLIEHETGSKGVFIADVVARKAVRELLIYSEQLYLSWDGTPEGLLQYNIEKKMTEQIKTYEEIEKNPDYLDSIIENAYLEELKVFLDQVRGKTAAARHTFEEDQYILGLIDRIEGVETEQEYFRLLR